MTKKDRIVKANYVALITGDCEENNKIYVNQKKPVKVIIKGD